jgi:hypothetical protein
MVAVSLLAVIIVGLLAMFYQVQRAFRAGTAQVDVMEGGRATMGILTRELQEMIPLREWDRMNLLITPPAEKSIFPAPPPMPDGVTAQDILGGQTRNNYLRDVCFLTKENDEWVGVAYRFSNVVSGVGTLYRMEERRYGDSNPESNRLILRDISQLVTTSRVDNLSFHQVLDGVVHFYIDPFYTNGLAIKNQFQLPGQVETYSYGFTNQWLPAQLDVELGVLEPSAVSKFRARLDVSLNQATNYLARTSGRTHLFRQRVAIKAVQAGLDHPY